VVALVVLAGCATGAPRGSLLVGYRSPSLAPAFPREAKGAVPQVVASAFGEVTEREEEEEEPDWGEDDLEEEEEGTSTGAPSRSRERQRTMGGDEPLEEWGEGWVGWSDGIGDGRPQAVPMSLDYFQGFLTQAGVPAEALPVDGRALTPEQALRLWPHLLDTEVTLGDFGRRRMAAHLLLEVATGTGPVTREELHARMARFHQLLVLRLDGYLVRPMTGEAVQKVGEVRLAGDGALRAGQYEVGPFYAVEGGRLWPVDAGLEVPRGVSPLGPYQPDNGVLLPALEGAGLAVVDTVEGVYRLVFHTEETLVGLTQLPGAVRELVRNAPEYWEEFRHKPRGEKVRAISRLTANVLLTVGTSGTGAAKAAAWGGGLGQVSVPLLSLTGRGELVLRLVAVPGRAVGVAGQALSATHVVHMATVGVVAAGGGGAWTPPVGGPGQWVPRKEWMSEGSRDFQHKVTKAPAGWVYRVLHNGEKADFDGRNPSSGVLLETKGLGYDKHFDAELRPKKYFKGAAKLVRQAARQSEVANGIPIRWHVAEPRMVDILKRLFKRNNITGIDVVYTPP
jgi:hypothetical protein